MFRRNPFRMTRAQKRASRARDAENDELRYEMTRAYINGHIALGNALHNAIIESYGGANYAFHDVDSLADGETWDDRVRQERKKVREMEAWDVGDSPIKDDDKEA